MRTTTVHQGRRGFFRRAAAVLTTSAIVMSGCLLGSGSAAAAEPLIATCVLTDDGGASAGVTGTVLGIPPLAILRVEFRDSDTNALLGTSLQVTVLGNVITIPLTGISAPTGSTGAVDISLVNVVTGAVYPVVGHTVCDTLPTDGVFGSFEAVAPTRLLDTRNAIGVPSNVAIPANGTISVKMTGVGPVPAGGVSAVSLTITATRGLAAGFITVFPTGTTRPTTSSLNHRANQDVANSVIAQPGSGTSTGRVSFYNGSSQPVHLIADVSGYYRGGLLQGLLLPGAYAPVTSKRIFDSRTNGGPLGQSQFRDVQVTGVAGVPAGVSSVALNLTAVNTFTTGFLSAYPAGTVRPYVSSLNFRARQTVSNQAIVPVSSDGKVRIYHGSISQSPADAIVDIVGYFGGGLLPVQTAGLQRGLTPVRLLDTRAANGVPNRAKVAGKGTVALQLNGRPGSGIPSTGVRAVLLTVTVTQQTSSGFASIYPGGFPRPFTSVLNFERSGDTANQVVAAVGANGQINVYNGSNTPAHLVVDVTGYINGSTLVIG